LKKLFYHSYSPVAFNIAALILRIVFGLLMLPHGWDKLSHFAEKKHKFMNFLGLGSSLSLGLATFAEFFCSILLILGLFTRLATIPLLVTIFVILNLHHWQFYGPNELEPAFLAAFLAILLFGPANTVLTHRSVRNNRLQPEF
jgi:putative oxidoreductase